jgi:glycosyltransferase involved in cell wall biosynthesis
LVATPEGAAALLVPAEDPVELAAAVARVLDEPELRNVLTRRGLQRAETWPDAEQTIRSVMALYDELVGRTP